MKILSIALSFCMAVALPHGFSAACAGEPDATGHRRADVDELLAADRAFAAAAVDQGVLAGFGAMFDADVIYTTESGRLFRGKHAAIAAIAADSAMAGASIDWRPVRGGISADGRHGFSFGFMTRHGADGRTTPLKYLAYWIKGSDGWRAAGYKYTRRPEGAVAGETMAPLLPGHAVAFDPAGERRHAAGLAAAEKGFSDEAQSMGLAEAFAKNGTADSMNMGRKAGFTIGSDSIGRELFGAPRPGSPIEWSSDGVRVASSGDLGLSWGTIRAHDADAAEAFAFFTIWRRDDTTEPWRYVAE